MKSTVCLFLYGEINTDGRVQRSIDFFQSIGNINITLISCGMNDFPIEGVTQYQIKRKPLGLSNYFKYLQEAKKYIKQADVERTLFYLHDYYSIPLAQVVKSVMGAFVYDAHELLLKAPGQRYTLREKLFIWAEKHWAKDAYRVIAANAEREQVMKDVYGLTNTLNILNIADYKYKQVAGTVATSTDWIVYQGVVTESRKLSFFIHSLKYLPETYKLMIIGGGSDGGPGDRELLENIAKEDGLFERVQFTGRMANRDMMEKLKECKVGIITYPFNTYNNIYCSPNKIYEYTAIGMPVISSKQPFLEKVVTDYKIGGLFDFDNVEDFAKTVEDIISHYDEYTVNIPAFVKDYNVSIEKQKFVKALSPIIQTMKIRHFLLYGSLDPKFGGPTYSVPIQCIGTQRLGGEMSFVVYEESKPFEERLLAEGVKMIHLSVPKNKFQHSWASNLKAYLSCSQDKPDILHFHGVWMPANLWVSQFGRKHHIPYVINPRGDTEIARINYNKLKKLKKQLVWRLYGKSIVDNAACIIATSEQERKSIRTLGSNVPVAIIPNGIEIDAFPKKVVHHHGEKKVLLFLSRINPIKGIEYLIDAWSNLPEALREEWELHIAGNSDPKEYIHTLEIKVESSMGLAESIKFVGFITGEDKMRKYQDANLFILPTLNENFGNVVAEAMMCECPVITTKNAPWSCLNEDKCGWWIDLSVDDLVKTMSEAMSLTDDERHELGRKSRQSIINRYSAESVAKKTYRLYEWVMGKCEKPEFVEG